MPPYLEPKISLGCEDQIVQKLISSPSLGVMMQVGNAFQKVHGGFALFLHNWTTITELRSIWKRLKEFEMNLERFESDASTQPV